MVQLNKVGPGVRAARPVAQAFSMLRGLQMKLEDPGTECQLVPSCPCDSLSVSLSLHICISGIYQPSLIELPVLFSKVPSLLCCLSP